jgi:hypothetical protein
MAYSPKNFGGATDIARATSKRGINNTGASMPMAQPVKVNSSGISKIDISSESAVQALAGVLNAQVLDGGVAEIVSAGSVENITTSFSFGDPVWIGTDGNLTNIQPVAGTSGFAAGDFVVRIGVIAKNADNPSQKDLLLSMSVIGQL